MTTTHKQSGVWLDTQKAFLVIFQNGTEQTKTIESNIEDFHPIGGARSKSPWGPMDKVSEKKYEERRKHQQRKYFADIAEDLKGSNHIYLFGPASTKNQLADYLEQQSFFRDTTINTATADVLTDPQKIAAAKAYFKI